MWYIIGSLIIIIGFLTIKLFQKKEFDKQQLEFYNKKISQAQIDVATWAQNLQELRINEAKLKAKLNNEQLRLNQCEEDIQKALVTYQELTGKKLEELEKSIEEQRQKRQTDLDTQFEERKSRLNLHMQQLTEQAQQEVNKAEIEAQEKINQLEIRKQDALNSTNDQIQKFESIIEVLRKYDLDRQAKLFYTIQLPEEYYDDINYLLTTVSEKVQHPDVISKLVWTEYVKPYIEDTFKRVEIKSEPGIYKLTSLLTGKCYIGKSTNVRNRIADHFKSVVGIKSIADQAVHHAILKEGFWNWQIEIITYCDKERLNELEKYYIAFFKAQEFGYNKTAGG